MEDLGVDMSDTSDVSIGSFHFKCSAAWFDLTVLWSSFQEPVWCSQCSD
jgi:hypothetical protein